MTRDMVLPLPLPAAGGWVLPPAPPLLLLLLSAAPLPTMLRPTIPCRRRSINLMDEFLLLEHIKDRLCFVSQDVAADLAASRGRSSKYK